LINQNDRIVQQGLFVTLVATRVRVKQDTNQLSHEASK